MKRMLCSSFEMILQTLRNLKESIWFRTMRRTTHTCRFPVQYLFTIHYEKGLDQGVQEPAQVLSDTAYLDDLLKGLD